MAFARRRRLAKAEVVEKAEKQYSMMMILLLHYYSVLLKNEYAPSPDTVKLFVMKVSASFSCGLHNAI